MASHQTPPLPVGRIQGGSAVAAVCPACRGALCIREGAAVCRDCLAQYPASPDGLSICFLVDNAGEPTDFQRQIYDGERQAGIQLRYVNTMEYERHFTNTIKDIDCLGFAAKTMRDIMNRRQFNRIGFREGMEVLDIGSGSGYLLNTLARIYRIRGTGVDISSLAVQRCRELNPQHLCFHVADAERLPFPEASFDRVVSFDVLEHLPHQRAALAEAARVLKPGGRMLWYVVSARDRYTWHWTQRFVSGGRVGRDQGGGHRRELFLDPDRATDWLSEFGFVEIHLVPFHSFFTLLIDERLPRMAGLAARLPGGLGLLFHLASAADLPLTAAGLGNGFYLRAERAR